MKVLITLYVEIEMPANTSYETVLDEARTAGTLMIDDINRHWSHVATVRVANVQVMAEPYHIIPRPRVRIK